MQKIHFSEIFMSPLHDPIFRAIFANVGVAGLAMESLINAVLKSDNEPPLGKIMSVTPQQIHDSPHNFANGKKNAESDPHQYLGL